MNNKSRKFGKLILPFSETVYVLAMARSNKILKGIKDKEIESKLDNEENEFKEYRI